MNTYSLIVPRVNIKKPYKKFVNIHILAITRIEESLKFKSTSCRPWSPPRRTGVDDHLLFKALF